MAEGLRLAVFLEEGTNPTEFHYCRLRLREAGLGVTTVGLDRLEYRLEDHSQACADAAVQQVVGQAFDGVVIPGGLGPEKLRLDARVLEVVRGCVARGKLCAAICHGQQVLISAGLLRGIQATAAWSMLDDLRAAGAIVPVGKRAVRDGQFVTAVFPQDLPAFFHLIFEALADLERWRPPERYPERLVGQTWGIVVDDASDATQVHYLRLRVQEEGGRALLLGRRAGQQVALSSPAWEWGEMGLRIVVERALADPGVIASCDTQAELDSHAVIRDEIDGLLLPGGLGTWMIRGHPGLVKLIREANEVGTPIGATERGIKLLLSAGVLAGRTVTCAPQARDDILHAVTPVRFEDVPVVHDGNLLTCQGTEDLPLFMETLVAAYGRR